MYVSATQFCLATHVVNVGIKYYGSSIQNHRMVGVLQ